MVSTSMIAAVAHGAGFRSGSHGVASGLWLLSKASWTLKWPRSTPFSCQSLSTGGRPFAARMMSDSTTTTTRTTTTVTAAVPRRGASSSSTGEPPAQSSQAEAERERKPEPKWVAIHDAACARGDLSYRDPDTGYSVFTAVAHRRRGKCCGSRCRHCPFEWVNVRERSAPQPDKQRQWRRQQQQQLPVDVEDVVGGEDEPRRA